MEQEKELFAPIKEYFEKEGYVADGEVNDIDLYMEKDGETVAVELKRTLDYKSVIQASLRQKITDSVYIGIFTPANLFSKSFKEKIYLLNRLGIGLITVSNRSGKVNIVCEPVIHELSSYKSHNKKKKEALQHEFNGRKVKSNTGGVCRQKLVTSYREDAIIVLDTLVSLGGESSPKLVKEASGIEKTPSILRANYYGWFFNKATGIYAVTEKGYDALVEFEDVLYSLRKKESE